MRFEFLLAIALAAARPVSAVELEARPVEVRPVFLTQMGELIGGRISFGPHSFNTPELELDNLEALTVARDVSPSGVARAEAAKLLVGYLAHPAEASRQQAALTLQLGAVRAEWVAQNAKALHAAARQRPALAQRLERLEKSVPEPSLGVDGSVDRLSVLFDGWKEKWDTSAPPVVPGAARTQIYTLQKPDGRTALTRSVKVPRAPAQAARVDPFQALVGSLSRKVSKFERKFGLEDEPEEFSDARLMGGTLALAAAGLGLIGAIVGVPASWKLLTFLPLAVWGAFLGRGAARSFAERVGWLIRGVDFKTGEKFSSPLAEEKLWEAQRKLEARQGIAVAVGALLAFVGMGWLMFGPPLAGAWISALAGMPVGIHPPFWTYLVSAVGVVSGGGLIGWAWGLGRVEKLAQTAAELVALDGTRKQGGS